MTTNEAIELLITHTHTPGITQFPELVDAVRLGIEALKVISITRRFYKLYYFAPLPGETVNLKGA